MILRHGKPPWGKARFWVVVFLLSVLCGCMAPDDSTLLREFQKQKGDFETIVTMSRQDSRLVRIAPTFTRLDDDWSWPRSPAKLGLTSQRWDEYKRLFKRTGLQDGLYSSHAGKQLFLVAYSGGMMGRGEAVGYVYCGDPVTATADSLPPCTDGKQSFTSDKYRYQKISDHWYIFDEY
jgi:hypothetical protein